ncbi:hypothetical protein [Klebsiella pneumoniae]|uniref:hypothetical protein n=1 Tax=Klebsiella pneumoniae TaxID=573 RepID=UPI00235E71E7|nr:hypothetical protein [Klebsiella pneumoniae]MDD1193739.1 hypothetical protein [Klebsiella pneumoniae]
MDVFSYSAVSLNESEKEELSAVVRDIHSECPGQIQSRFLSRIKEIKDKITNSRIVKKFNFHEPLLISNLPEFENIELSKILLLTLGESIGRCVAYSDYNQSYVTDIRPTLTSRELSSSSELLTMHNDLCFASDRCRPEYLVLVPHIANGDIPKTLLATSAQLVEFFTKEELSILQSEIFEMRAGGKLLWPNEEIRKMKIIEKEINGRIKIKLNFSNIKPAPGLSEPLYKQAEELLEKLASLALRVGRENGHSIQKGEALIIPNNYAVHGRDVFTSDNIQRLLLRSYVVSQNVVDSFSGNTMISIRN